MYAVLRRIVLGSLIAGCLAGSAAAENEAAKWFVLRQDTTGYCWTGLVISINGEYAHSFAQLAGGPFETKPEALAREKELDRGGSCANPS